MSQKLSDLFVRQWRCEVYDSGYHNGVFCDPEDPHGGWACGYRWVAPRLTDSQAEQYGLTYPSECENPVHVHTAEAPDGTSQFCLFGESFEDANPHQ